MVVGLGGAILEKLDDGLAPSAVDLPLLCTSVRIIGILISVVVDDGPMLAHAGGASAPRRLWTHAPLMRATHKTGALVAPHGESVLQYV